MAIAGIDTSVTASLKPRPGLTAPKLPPTATTKAADSDGDGDSGAQDAAEKRGGIDVTG